MKRSTAAFWLLISLATLSAIVSIFGMIYPNKDNIEIIKLFLDIMKYVLTLVGGGYLGIQIGEKND